jgi:hypothetical protein
MTYSHYGNGRPLSKKIREDGRKKERKKQKRKKVNNLKFDVCCTRSQNQGLYNVITSLLFRSNVTYYIMSLPDSCFAAMSVTI